MNRYIISRVLGGYTVTDPYGAVIYRAKNSIFHLTATHILTDAAGNPVGKIRQRISPIVPAYTIEIEDETPIIIAQKLCFGTHFRIKGRPWKMDGIPIAAGYLVLDEKEEILYEVIKNDQRRQVSYTLTPKHSPLAGICLTIAADLSKRAIHQA